jgi:MOSC domain-containing protein YiiM
MTAHVAATLAGKVVGLASDDRHRFSKEPRTTLTLLENHGVRGDAHAGATVQHRSRAAQHPSPPNLRQVHLLHSEFFDLAAEQGYRLTGGDLGENILTAGLDVLALPRDTVLHLGSHAAVRVTGLRNPCWQIDRFRKGLLRVAVSRGADGEVVRRTGVMGVVTASGSVELGDPIRVTLPPEPHAALERV